MAGGSDSSMDDRNFVMSGDAWHAIRSSDSSMDDRNAVSGLESGRYSWVQIPLWTIGTGWSVKN